MEGGDVARVATPKPATLKQATLAFGSRLGLSTASASTCSLPSLTQNRDLPLCNTTEGVAEQSPCAASTGSAYSSSSILSSASAYVRRDMKCEFDGPTEVKVCLKLRLVGGSCTIAGNLTLKRVAITIPELKAKRRRYDNAAKVQILEVAETKGVAHALAIARNTPGYQRLTRKALCRWRRTIFKPKKRVGRKPCPDAFSRAILENLMYGTIEHAHGETRYRVLANVAYGFEMVRVAAYEARKQPQFLSDERIQKHKFSNNFVRTWAKNLKMSRRRVTSTTKVLPPPEEVQAKMSFIQEHLIDFFLDEIISADETGFNYGALPSHQIVPLDADRATAPDSDEKARFTAMLWGVAAGRMGSIFAIIKTSSKGADLTKTRVLKQLAKEKDFTEADGWTYAVWTKELTLKEKNKNVTRTYKVPYLKHTSGHIITIQKKAWMDTVRICMWIDLQLGPHYDSKRGFAGLVWDNCGPHGVQAVKDIASHWGITLLPLPPNMTDVLQVMDLVVNAPVKAKIRRDRVAKLYNEFQSWKIARMQAEKHKKPPPPFAPPKPKIVDGLRTLFELPNETFANPRFQQSLKRSFVDCCIAPNVTTETEVEFKVYKDHKHGSLNPHSLFDAADLVESEIGSLGAAVEMYDDTVVETRMDAEARDLGASSDESSDDSDDSGEDD